MKTLRVATTQFALRPEHSFEGFSAHLSHVVQRAADDGARVVVLPELVTTGLLASSPKAASIEVATIDAAYREVFPPLAEAFSGLVSELAARNSIWLLGGSHWRRREDGTFVNTAYLGRPDGGIETQDKLHLTPPEKAIGTSVGDNLIVAEIDSIRVGVLICADIQFPELTRHLVTEQDVQLILCPSLTWNTRGVNRVRYGSHSRAAENQIFVATSTLIGTDGMPGDAPLHAKGRAFIAGPIDRVFGANDGVLACTEDDDEGMAVLDLDFDQLAASRANPEPPGLSNLRPELYRSLAESTQVFS
jgi:predicted amidohydrolase